MDNTTQHNEDPRQLTMRHVSLAETAESHKVCRGFVGYGGEGNRLVAVTSPPSRAGRYCRALLMTCLSNDSHIWPWGASAKGLDAQRPSDDIGGKNLKQEFYGSLDRHCPQLIQVKERSLLKPSHHTSDLTDMQCVAIRGSPVLLGDDPTEFFKACFASDDGDSYQHVSFGILGRENKDVVLQPLSTV
ncbi:hypothetical protein QQF64_002436 [Cirrhinus molitorella]|uniref:Uncharacterized protein n=1 Tax=Cirrhinus molitorella TaxID=172907 RepID=A0ABR3MQ45_9TELE